MDIFISYRRNGGSVWADLLNTKLRALNLKVFYDKYKIENEDFTAKIQKSIEKSPNFLLIMSPGIFAQKTEGEDWVLKEIECALSLKKNIILLQVDNFKVEDDIVADNETLQHLTRLNMLKYVNDSPALEEASIMNIISKMVDKKGLPFKLGEQIYSNSWYDKYEMTDEDSLWIKTDYAVCHKWDQKMLQKALSEPVMKAKKQIDLFVLKCYDIETYAMKYDIVDSKGMPYITNVYGTTYESDIPLADETFGKGHFVADLNNELLVQEARECLRQNKLNGFDIIDMTLIIKDLSQPEKVVREMAKMLKPDGGVLFIRELDDDFVRGYPHEDIIKKLLELLEHNPGAGNRHTGRKVYTFLKHAGADKVYMSDEVISTANHKSKYQELIFQTYFSYLKPELRNLTKEDPDTFADDYRWVEKNFDNIENMFCSSEFYFRAGYVIGYGVFENE